MAGRRTPKKTSRSDGAPVRADKADDSFARETFTLPREQARERARAYLIRWPTAAYMSVVESWRELQTR